MTEHPTDAMPGPIRRVVHELRLSTQVFRDYGYQHQDKADEATTPKERSDRQWKAKRNFDRAAACEAALDDFDAMMEAAKPSTPKKGLKIEPAQPVVLEDETGAYSTPIDEGLVEKLRAAFMSGWMTRHNSEAQPEDAFAIYLKSHGLKPNVS